LKYYNPFKKITHGKSSMNVPDAYTRRRTGIRGGLLAGLTATGLLSSGTAGFAQALQAPNNLSDVDSATKSIQNLFSGQITGIQPEAFGARRDEGATGNTDTQALVAAANFAATNGLGVTLSNGGGYCTTPLQLGGSTPVTATVIGNISGSVLTVTDPGSGTLAVPDAVSFAGATPGTVIKSLGAVAGTYNLSIPVASPLTGVTISAGKVTVAALPQFFKGAAGGKPLLLACGGTSTTEAVLSIENQASAGFTAGTVNNFEIGNLNISGDLRYAYALRLHGFIFSYAHDLTLQRANLDGLYVHGNLDHNTQYSTLGNIASFSNGRDGFRFVSDQGDDANYIAANFIYGLRGQFNAGSGIHTDWATVTGAGIESESNGRYGLDVVNSTSGTYTGIHTEGNTLGGINGIACAGGVGSCGLHFDGGRAGGAEPFAVAPALLTCATCDIEIETTTGTAVRNQGAMSGLSATLKQDGIGGTPTAAVTLSNSTAATAGFQQWAPQIQFSGQGWASGPAASQQVDWRVQTSIQPGVTNPVGRMTWTYQVNGGGYDGAMGLSPGGFLNVVGGYNIGGVSAAANHVLCGNGSSYVDCATLPVSVLSGLGTGVATFLATPSSANLFTALTTKTGTGGNVVFGTSPNITTPTGIVKGDVGLGSVPNVDMTNLSNATGGTVAAARGGAGTITGALKGNGAGVVSQAACADLSNGAAGCSAAAGQLPGTAAMDKASTGNVGEYVSSVTTSGFAVPLMPTITANIASISLTAGDWDVTGLAAFALGATTNVTYLTASLSATTATSDTSMDRLLIQDFGTGQVIGTAGGNPRYPLPTSRFSLSATTTIFLVTNCGFTVSTNAAYGIIRARRVR
jgi:hypothetical protein